ncbi:MAG: hypothetical protein IPL61_28660 [Myxococcales bacterium]|nr:hypothetical protein [Myxococcales bacterium]
MRPRAVSIILALSAACSGGGDSPPLPIDAPGGLDAPGADAADIDGPIVLVDAGRDGGGPRDGTGPLDGPIGVDCVLGAEIVGPGVGRVVSNPAGINCAPDCRETLPCGTQVTLTALPTPPSTFRGWTGACSGTGACTVTVNGAFVLVLAGFN